MPGARSIVVRIEELRAILAAYQQAPSDEEQDWADLETEIEDEVWRLEQDLAEEPVRPRWAA
jgi:hypothetical protein